MIRVVGEDNGAEIWQYHYSLALAMLQDAGYLLFVFVAWLLYTRKCVLFVSDLLKQPDYSFMAVCNGFNRARRFLEFLWVAIWLLLPIVLYGVAVVVYGWIHHLYLPIIAVAVFLLSLCICSALWFVYTLDKPHKETAAIHLRLPLSSSYGMSLLRQVAQKQKNPSPRPCLSRYTCNYGDALLFSLCAYGLVLLMNSITFLGNFSRKEYLFLLLMVFCVEYIFLGGIGIPLLCGLLFAAALIAFLAGYYRFERAIV